MVKDIKFPDEVRQMTYEEVEVQFTGLIHRYVHKWFKLLKMNYEDLYQELRVETYRCYINYDVGFGACFSTYLSATLNGTIKKLIRYKDKLLETCDISEIVFYLSDNQFEDEIMQKCLYEEVAKEIKKLDEYSQKLIRLRYVNELSFYKIADIFGRNYNAIWMKHKRSLEQIKRKLDIKENKYELS